MQRIQCGLVLWMRSIRALRLLRNVPLTVEIFFGRFPVDPPDRRPRSADQPGDAGASPESGDEGDEGEAQSSSGGGRSCATYRKGNRQRERALAGAPAWADVPLAPGGATGAR